MKVGVEDLVGKWVGPKTSFEYNLRAVGGIILIHIDDLSALQKKHGQENLTVV